MNIETATEADIDFLIECITESEKSGTDIMSWQRILDIPESAVRKLIRDVLLEEIEGQEWHIPHFRIVRQKGQYVAGLSIWSEAMNGISSGILKSQAISWFLPEEWRNAAPKLEIVRKVQIPRLPGVLQLENIYTRPEFRGQGLASKLILASIRDEMLRDDAAELAEIQLMSENEGAMRTYIKCGFIKRLQSAETDDAVLTLLPGKTRTSLIRNLTHGNI